MFKFKNKCYTMVMLSDNLHVSYIILKQGKIPE